MDRFAPTVHVENVVCLSKGDVKSKKIRVEFSLEDMDTDGFRKGATYNAIRDWIKEKYGYRVTNLNIAQVKQKHGIIERENYNKPKSPGANRPVDDCSAPTVVKRRQIAMRSISLVSDSVGASASQRCPPDTRTLCDFLRILAERFRETLIKSVFP